MGGRVDNPINQVIHSLSPEQTRGVGAALAHQLPPDTVICLRGDLGAGKTCFVSGLVEGYSDGSAREVCSPTFNLLNIYGKDSPVFHFDLYRLSNMEEFLMMGFDEYFSAGGISCVEWSERIIELLDGGYIEVTIQHKEEEERTITILDKR